MSSLNKVILIGNLGKDPVLNHTGGGTPVCNMTIATSETIIDKKTNEKKETTDWHTVVVWGKQALNCEKYLKKGSKIGVEGSLRTESYEKNGVRKFATKVIAHRVEFLSSQQSEALPDHLSEENLPPPPEGMYEGIPF